MDKAPKTQRSKKPELTEDQIVSQEFARRFSSWDIPVSSLQDSLNAMTNEQRQAHYLEVREILARPAFHREIQDWKRRVSCILAMGQAAGKPLTELELQGLRILMLNIDEFEKILRQRSMLVRSTDTLRTGVLRV